MADALEQALVWVQAIDKAGADANEQMRKANASPEAEVIQLAIAGQLAYANTLAAATFYMQHVQPHVAPEPEE